MKTEPTVQPDNGPGHGYVRGSTARFYQWLEAFRPVLLPKGPQAWICGDCHVGNAAPSGASGLRYSSPSAREEPNATA